MANSFFIPEPQAGFDLFSRAKNAMHRVFGIPFSIFAAIDQQAAAEPSGHPHDARRATQILLLSALLLTLVYSCCQPTTFISLFGNALAQSPRLGRYIQLGSLSYWCMTRMFLLVLIPMIHLRLWGERLSDYGLGMGFSSAADPPAVGAEAAPRISLRTYLALLLLMLPIIAAMSFSPSFQRTYPLYRQASRSLIEFLVWELEYLSTFFTIEFFFRGYLLFGLRRALGSQALFVAVLPYCMFHFGKPPAEALASIIAGLILGTLAQASRTIWGGVILHAGVALSMDLAVLLQRHALPGWSRLLPT